MLKIRRYVVGFERILVFMHMHKVYLACSGRKPCSNMYFYGYVLAVTSPGGTPTSIYMNNNAIVHFSHEHVNQMCFF